MNRPVCFSRMEAAIFTVYAVTTARVTWRPANRCQNAQADRWSMASWVIRKCHFFFHHI